MKISVIGVGYLGLTTSSVLASSGFKVYAIDINPEVINKVKMGVPHFYERGLDKLVENSVKSKKLIPTLDYSKAIPDSDISFICVSTPEGKDGSLSISGVKAAAESIAKHMKDGHIIVMKSTVPLGTHKVIKDLIKSKTKKNFHYVSKPEFLTEGSAVFDTILPDRIIIGTEDDVVFKKIYKIFEKVDEFAKTTNTGYLKKFSKIYREKFASNKPYKERVLQVKTESAELIKVTANSFLALKISFSNAISRLTDKIGADVNEVFDGLGADPRIGRDFFYSGLGWGGGCFPKDLNGLVADAKSLGYDFNLLKEVANINYSQIDFVTKKALEILGKKTNKLTVTVLGLAFKPGTDDIRISPAISLTKELSKHFKQINVIDPKANENAKGLLNEVDNIYWSSSIEDALNGTSLIILATDWPEYNELDFKKYKKLVKEANLLDGRNRWDREKAVKAGFKYYGIGR